MHERRKSNVVRLGRVEVGGLAPIAVQTMTNTDTRNVAATTTQIKALASAGAEIVRLAIPDQEAAEALKAIRRLVLDVPLVADIHFDFRLALAAINAGVDGLRINPGNIGSRDKVAEVVNKARLATIPIRIGVNAGSLDKRLLEKYGGITAAALAESALQHVEILERLDFTQIKISVKASDVPLTVAAYKILAEKVPYPFHIGITEAGTLERGLVKSAAGLSLLLAEGLGDTLRVSLTADPQHEVWAGYEILKALQLRKHGAEIVSCPTCGRTEIDLIKLATAVEKHLKNIDYPLKVAVMGCVVNGPGEARDADIGVAGGKGYGLIFRKGNPLRKVPEDKILEELLKEVEKFEEDKDVR